MTDIFDNTILCKHCGTKMQKAQLAKSGFILRAVVCNKCGDKIIHPADEAEYRKFVELKKKEFQVKMRMVGNSYTVSIPKEIVSFIREQEKVMNDMVRLCFEDAGRLSLNFNEDEMDEDEKRVSSRVVKAGEVKVIKNGKPVFHSKQFYDSAHPERSQKVYKIDEQNHPIADDLEED